jgi:hypothetical protein
MSVGAGEAGGVHCADTVVCGAPGAAVLTADETLADRSVMRDGTWKFA